MVDSLSQHSGGAGTQVLPSMTSVIPTLKSLNEAFDLVSWDPRGIGKSTPVTCGFETSADLVKFARKLGVKDPNATSRMVVGDTYPMTNDEVNISCLAEIVRFRPHA